MEPYVIETQGCPLDFNLSKIKQDSSHTYTSDYSDSTDEEADKNNDLIDQFKQLSFAEVPNYKYITPKPTNKTSEGNSQEENSSGESILVENKDIEEIQSPSFPLKAEVSLKFVTEAKGKSTFRNCSNKKYSGIYSKKSKNEKVNFEDNLGSVENQLSSLSLKSNKILNKCYKNNSNIPDDDKYDFDLDEQAKSVTLRERGHTKHNRPENNRQQRQTPFNQNASTSRPHLNSSCLQAFENFGPPVSHTHIRPKSNNHHERSKNNNQQLPTPLTQIASTSSHNLNSKCLQTFENFSPPVSHTHLKPKSNNHHHYRPINNNQQLPTLLTQNASTSSHHFNSNCLQTFENSSPPVSFGSNTPHDGYNSNSHTNSNDLETNRGFHSSSTTLDSDFSTSDWESHQIFGSEASGTATDDVVTNGVPFIEAAVPEYIVPLEEDTRNLNDQFSSEPNDTSIFDNANERSFSGYAEVNVGTENFSDSGIEHLSEEEFLNILESVTDSTPADLSSKNPLHISNKNLVQFSNEDLNIISVSSDCSIPDRNFYSSSITLQSDFPTSEWETSQILRSVASSTMSGEVVNNGVPHTEEVVPEYVVPCCEENTRNLNGQFSSEPNDTSFFDSSNERSFSGFTEGYVETENSSNFGLEKLAEEEFLNILISTADSTSVDLSSQNPVEISNENLLQFTNEDLNNIGASNSSSIPDQNFYPSSITLHSDPPSECETHQIFESVASSTMTDEVVDNGIPYTEDAVPEYVVTSEEDTRNLNGQFSSERNVKSFFDNSNEKSFSAYAGGYAETENSSYFGLENLTEEEFLNILGTDLTSDYYSDQNPEIISNENLVQLSDEDLDIISVSRDSSVPDQNGIQYIEATYPIINQEEQPRNNINQTITSTNRTEETQIYTSLATSARAVLFDSPSFCKSKWHREYEDIIQQIQRGELGTEEKTVIHMTPKKRKTKYRGTNLHHAIREEEIERVFCLVECHKACHGCLNTEINLRDNTNKTVLDYSKEKKLDLLTAYLEENKAESFSYICN